MYKELKQKLLPLYQKFEPKDINRLSVFNVQVGSSWQKSIGILFVGKATNGWKNILFSDLDSKLFSEYDKNKDVLSWIEEYKANSEGEYSTKRSAFWRIIEKISRKEFDSSSNWYSNIAWSNLCKLAPIERGNPTAKDFHKQKDICKEILLTEIDILKPKVVILLTSDWDILGINKFEKIDEVKWSNFSSILYKNRGVYYIHTSHPQGKPEDKHRDAICSLINTLRKKND